MIQVDHYRKINESYSRKLAFRLGIDAGFFSEYNNMILAMVWCLKHRVQFSLYSENAWFSPQGWTEFFEPFCKEEKSRLHLTINTRQAPPSPGKKARLLTAWAKLRYGIDYFTWQLWPEFHNRNLENESFDLPELGIHGDIRDACRELISMTWRYNPDTKSTINQLIEPLGLPSQYIGFHIRGGDKFKEDDLKPIDHYFEAIQDRSDCRNAFVLTDDYRIIETIRQDYSDWKIFTLCSARERGYYHHEFMKQSQPIIHEQTLRLFASMDILRNSELFFGTFSSNPGMYLGMRMERDRCLDVSGREWFIW